MNFSARGFLRLVGILTLVRARAGAARKAWRGIGALLLFACLLSGSAAAGPVVTINSDGDNVYFHPGSYVLGWRFSVSAPVEVTGLGFWDYTGDGFHLTTGELTSVEVGLWDSSETLLTSLSVLSTDPITNVLTDGSGFRFHDLSSHYLLAPGTYYIGGTNHGTESYVFYPQADVSYDPAVTWLSGQYAYSETLVFPGTTDCCTPAGWFGPNFTIEAATGVPEPGAATLLLLGCAVFSARALRRARRH